MSRLASSTFYAGKTMDESQTSEGFLYKRGKIVKNWKQRWFILDTDRREVCDNFRVSSTDTNTMLARALSPV